MLIPFTKYFWKNAYTIRTGSITRVLAAIEGPGNLAYACVK